MKPLPSPPSDNLTINDVLQEMEELLHSSQAPSRPHRAIGSFLLGFMVASLVALIVYTRFNATIVRASRRLQRRRLSQTLDQMSQEEIRNILGSTNLPVWLSAPDFERVRWVNRVIAQMFPFAARYAESWASQNVDTLLRENSPSWIRSIKMTHCTAGRTPPKVTGVKVFSEDDLGGHDEIAVEFDVVWHSDAEVTITVQPIPKSRLPGIPQNWAVVDRILNSATGLLLVKTSVEKLFLEGRLRLVLRPLMSAPPIVGSAQISFAALPDFSFDLKLWNGNAAVLPGLESWLYATIKDSVLRQFTLPEKLVVPLIPENQLFADRPRGVLEVEVIAAKNVPWMDLFSPSDPYMRLFTRVGHQMMTQVIDNNSNPQWNERFLLLVHHPSEQDLTMILMDYDVFDQDDEIGRVELHIKDIIEAQEARQQPQKQGDTSTIDRWFPVTATTKVKGRLGKVGKAVGRVISPSMSSKVGEPHTAGAPGEGGGDALGGFPVHRHHHEGDEDNYGGACDAYDDDDDDNHKHNHHGALHIPFLHPHRHRRQCQLHVRLTYVEFPRDEVDRFIKSHFETSSTTEHERVGWGGNEEESRDEAGWEGEGEQVSKAFGRVKDGGALFIRVRTASDLDFSAKSFIIGGWSHKLKVKVTFAGQTKATPAITGRRQTYNIDSEVEFVIDSEQAHAADVVRFEVWDVHWKNARLGVGAMDWGWVHRSGPVVDTVELRGADGGVTGRLDVRCQWMGLLSSTTIGAGAGSDGAPRAF